ncbi:MAG: hypothetical protein A2902_03045 [Elusimicrobia bacterium RIFCSPLOWO2_01_FULL_64_13]|nr:MAG: hypothetical protein A2636_06220 [Elusimicrobia bacterium RIFCSPHIGHO2_01_FULL_64_10]OGR97273.1 MAG: hypothetical protein A2902_03045 [Elusimicrobia bacterium RIFCSPLOWO2_01_FULL_64_13]
MIECELKIENRLGLHARPASLFVRTTNRFKSKIRVIKDNMEVDGKSIMGLLMLAAPMGTVLKVIADGEDEANLVETLRNLFASKFGENHEGPEAKANP